MIAMDVRQPHCREGCPSFARAATPNYFEQDSLVLVMSVTKKLAPAGESLNLLVPPLSRLRHRSSPALFLVTEEPMIIPRFGNSFQSFSDSPARASSTIRFAACTAAGEAMSDADLPLITR